MTFAPGAAAEGDGTAIVSTDGDASTETPGDEDDSATADDDPANIPTATEGVVGADLALNLVGTGTSRGSCR